MDYQLYFLKHDGSRSACFAFESADDERAEVAAELFGCERGGELWCGARPVRTWAVQPETELVPEVRALARA
jgi:hypothetical protein